MFNQVTRGEDGAADGHSTLRTPENSYALSNYSKSGRIFYKRARLTMQDRRVYDMINVFKFSPTRIGSRRVGGDAEFQSRYQRLANDVADELWRLWNGEEIGFDDLPTKTYGDSDRRRGYDICVNRDYEPSLLTYHLPPEQSKLAAASHDLSARGCAFGPRI